ATSDRQRGPALATGGRAAVTAGGGRRLGHRGVVGLFALRAAAGVFARRLVADQGVVSSAPRGVRSLAAVVARDLVALRGVVAVAREGVGAVGFGVAALRGGGAPVPRAQRGPALATGGRATVAACSGRRLGNRRGVGLQALGCGSGVPERQLVAERGVVRCARGVRSLAAAVARDLVALRGLVAVARGDAAAVGGGAATLGVLRARRQRGSAIATRSRAAFAAGRGRRLGH